MSNQSRIDVLTKKLSARTTRDGKPVAGYEQNVASIKAELALLQEQVQNNG